MYVRACKYNPSQSHNKWCPVMITIFLNINVTFMNNYLVSQSYLFRLNGLIYYELKLKGSQLLIHSLHIDAPLSLFWHLQNFLNCPNYL